MGPYLKSIFRKSQNSEPTLVSFVLFYRDRQK